MMSFCRICRSSAVRSLSVSKDFPLLVLIITPVDLTSDFKAFRLQGTIPEDGPLRGRRDSGLGFYAAKNVAQFDFQSRFISSVGTCKTNVTRCPVLIEVKQNLLSDGHDARFAEQEVPVFVYHPLDLVQIGLGKVPKSALEPEVFFNQVSFGGKVYRIAHAPFHFI